MKDLVRNRSLFALLLAFACLATLAPALHAQSVRVNWSKNAPFTDYKTVAWVPSKDDNHPFYRQYVGEYVRAALTKKHMQVVPMSQNPDLIATYHFLTQESQETNTTYEGMGGGGWGGWGMGGWGMGMGMGGMGFANTTNEPVTIGILTVDLIDAKTKHLVWRGQATEDNVVTASKGEEKDVAKAVYKMFDHYPPK